MIYKYMFIWCFEVRVVYCGWLKNMKSFSWACAQAPKRPGMGAKRLRTGGAKLWQQKDEQVAKTKQPVLGLPRMVPHPSTDRVLR